MFDNLSYKQKNIGLLAGAILLVIVIYRFSIIETLNLKAEIEVLKEQLKQVEDAPMEIARLNAELVAIDKVLGNSGAGDNEYQQVLLEKTSNWCSKNNLTLKEFPQPWVKQEREFNVETNLIVVEGGYLSLLKLLYQLEKKERLGKIASVQFKKEKELRTKREYLTAAIYLQTLKKEGS